jgi:polysaccharide export outer membrane protein
MKPEFCLLLAMAATPIFAQQTAPERVSSNAISQSDHSTLPAERVGPDDLLGISVYDSPELSHPVRVDADGAIRLSMVKQAIPVSGLYPVDIETAITKALVDGNVLVAPLVSVSVLEYRSRPITVMGAVRTPVVFQADGPVTLLDAISRAGGLAENAGPDILLSRPPSAPGAPAKITERISVQSFLNLDEDLASLKLEAGDVIRVPEAGQVYVLGSVKRPGAFSVNAGADSSVMKALAMSGGLDEHPSHIAYIYRVEAGAAGRNEMPIELKKIMDRKAPDVALEANDILYIPTANGRRIGSKILETSLAVSLGLSTALLYIYH